MKIVLPGWLLLYSLICSSQQTPDSVKINRSISLAADSVKIVVDTT